MRLRNWISVVVSVLLLAAAGSVGIWVNHSALQAADTVHRADSRALAVNNATLTGSMQQLSAAQLVSAIGDQIWHLTKDDPGDRQVLQSLVSKSEYFQYGAMIADLRGNVLTTTRTSGLPAANDPGWEPLRKALLSGRPGFSSIMVLDSPANTVFLEAVGVPITANGGGAVLIAFNNVATTPLQKFTAELSADTHLTRIVDSTGRVAATSNPDMLGTKIDQPIQDAIVADPTINFVEYEAGGTKMIAVVSAGLPGGWAYVRTQTQSSFDGAVHAKSQTLTMTLLAMLLIGVVAILILGYRTQMQRRRADERFQALFQHAPDLVSVLDANGVIAYSSPSAKAVLGYEMGTLVGTSVFDILHPDDRPLMRDKFQILLGHREAVLRLQCRARSAAGDYRWFEFTASNQMHNQALAGIVINARDVSENRAFQERLAHEAQHDALTGLPNRRRMQDALDVSLRNDPVAVLFVDLDGFKPVNDAHGHEAGDELLRQVAARLSACVREQDVLSRVGGDEFVILMPGVAAEADAEAMSHRIREALLHPFPIDGHEVRIGASVGVHLAPTSGDPDEALRCADHAMYTIKKGITARAGRHRAED